MEAAFGITARALSKHLSFKVETIDGKSKSSSKENETKVVNLWGKKKLIFIISFQERANLINFLNLKYKKHRNQIQKSIHDNTILYLRKVGPNEMSSSSKIVPCAPQRIKK